MKAFSHLTAILATLSVGYSAGINVDFDSYTFGTDLAGQGMWTIDDGSNAGISYVNASPFPVGSGGNAGQIGFQEIAGTSATVSHPVSVPADGATFNVTTLIQDSDNSFPTRDTFGFSLMGASGEVFGLYFSPQSQTGTPNGVLPPRVDDVSWRNDTVGDSGAIGTLTEGQYTTIEVVFTKLGVNDLQFALSSAGVPLLTDTISAAGVGDETFTSVGVVWELFDVGSNNEGANSIYFDDLSLVPEPSVLGLGALGLLSLVRRRRR